MTGGGADRGLSEAKRKICSVGSRERSRVEADWRSKSVVWRRSVGFFGKGERVEAVADRKEESGFSFSCGGARQKVSRLKIERGENETAAVNL